MTPHSSELLTDALAALAADVLIERQLPSFAALRVVPGGHDAALAFVFDAVAARWAVRRSLVQMAHAAAPTPGLLASLARIGRFQLNPDLLALGDTYVRQGRHPKGATPCALTQQLF